MSKAGPWILHDGELWTKAELDAHRLHEALKLKSRIIKDFVRPKMGRYVMRDMPDGKRELVDIANAPPVARKADGVQVIRDIEPYQAVGLPGAPWIKGGRAEHRAMLKRYNKVEVGNEWNGARAERRDPVTVPGYTAKQHLADLVYKRRPLDSDR